MTVRLRLIALLIPALVTAGCSSTAAPTPPSAPPSTAGTPSESAPPSLEPPSAAPSPSVAPSVATAPANPTDPTFDLINTIETGPGTFTEEYRITWSSPDGLATSFKVYGLIPCLRASEENNETPCVVRGMPIPTDQLVLLREVPGDARTTTVSWESGEIDVAPYAAILMRATNDAGDSIFTIVHSEDVCWACVY